MTTNPDFHCESCVVSLQQALEAQHRGAHRLELCARLETEGMTPDISLAVEILDQVSIPLRVMIRATETGYEADDLVLQKMIESIHQFKRLSIEGIVIGLLKNQRVDQKRMMLLIEAAFPLKVTFHKAIDLSIDVDADIRWLNPFSQVDTLLTSGGAIRATDGVQQILRMKSLFEGQIMAAGKITPEVLPSLHKQLGLRWYHGRAIV